MIMRTKVLRRYIEPLLAPELEHVQNIRIGTKALAYWPQRFVSDSDADECLDLFEEVAVAGRHLAIMGHYSHPIELESGMANEAVRRVRNTGAQIRMRGPLIRHVNDDPETWAGLWTNGVRLGLIITCSSSATPARVAISRCLSYGRSKYLKVPTHRSPACPARSGDHRCRHFQARFGCWVS